jgi:hypothetical protein
MKKKKSASSGLNPRPKSEMFKPKSQSDLEKKVLKYVRAALDFRVYDSDLRQACVAEAYQCAVVALTDSTLPCDDDIRRTVNRITGKIKRREDRFRHHQVSLVIANDDGDEVLLTDIVGVTSKINEKAIIKHIDMCHLAMRPTPKQAEKYRLTPVEQAFLDAYDAKRIVRDPAARKRASRLRDKRRAFLICDGLLGLVDDRERRAQKQAEWKKSREAMSQTGV